MSCTTTLYGEYVGQVSLEYVQNWKLTQHKLCFKSLKVYLVAKSSPSSKGHNSRMPLSRRKDDMSCTTFDSALNPSVNPN